MAYCKQCLLQGENVCHKTWDKRAEQTYNTVLAERQKLFWNQLFQVNTESYLADGDNFVYVTQNIKVWSDLLAKLKTKSA